MSVTMRIIQEYDITREDEFLALEAKFAELEAARDDYPKGKRLKPISASHPWNCLIWEGEFDDLDSARAAMDFFSGDDAHEKLFAKQQPMFRGVKIEFYENLQF